MALPKEVQSALTKSYSKDNLSVGQISRKYKIPASTISYYLDKHGITRRSRSDAVTLWHITEFSKKPYNLKKNLTTKNETLKLAGVMLYWAEGAKGGNGVKFINSDPQMIRVFLNFLRDICGIHEDRLKLLIHRYPDLDEGVLRNFWSSTTGVSKKNFYRSYVHLGKTGTYKNRSLHGTLSINYSDKKLLNQINLWIKEYKEKL